MNPMSNERPAMNGSSNEANHNAGARPGDDRREALPVARRAERRDASAPKRKPKPRQPRAVEPQQIAPPAPKPMWPVIVGAILIVLYICSPVDVIPDVPVIGAWDDIALAIFGMRKLDKRRKENEAAQRQFRQDWAQPMWQDEHARPRHPMPPHLACAPAAMLPPPEKPGFFARVMKAISIIFGGDQ